MSNYNIFSVLDEEGESQSTVKTQDKKAVASKAAAPARSTNSARRPANNSIQEDNRDFGRRTDRERSDRTSRGRGGRGGGRGRGSRPPKREFERHSGTGRGREVQKDGDGQFNWGSTKAEAEDGQEAAKPEGDEEPKVDGAEGAAESDEGEQFKSLSAYIEEDEVKRNELEELTAHLRQETRKAGDGDKQKWKKATSYSKDEKEEDEYYGGHGGKRFREKERYEKQNLASEFFTGSVGGGSDRGFRGGRGGRGGRGRGGGGDYRGGRGGGRGGYGNSNRAAFDVNNQQAFPALK
eukprot:Rmarinus@m.4850